MRVVLLLWIVANLIQRNVKFNSFLYLLFYVCLCRWGHIWAWYMRARGLIGATAQNDLMVRVYSTTWY